jgi:hypothetical protein
MMNSEDAAREERILMEVVVDAHDSDERAWKTRERRVLWTEVNENDMAGIF